jgi:hypothetical protein
MEQMAAVDKVVLEAAVVPVKAGLRVQTDTDPAAAAAAAADKQVQVELAELVAVTASLSCW